MPSGMTSLVPPPGKASSDHPRPCREEDAEVASNLVGRFRPPFRRVLDEYAYDKVAAMDDWVLADK